MDLGDFERCSIVPCDVIFSLEPGGLGGGRSERVDLWLGLWGRGTAFCVKGWILRLKDIKGYVYIICIYIYIWYVDNIDIVFSSKVEEDLGSIHEYWLMWHNMKINNSVESAWYMGHPLAVWCSTLFLCCAYMCGCIYIYIYTCNVCMYVCMYVRT